MAEPLRATFFALQKRDRAVLAPATIVFILIAALIVAAFVALNWRTLAHMVEFFQMSAQQKPGAAGEEAAVRFVFGMFGLMALAILFMFPLYLAVAAYEAACLRWMIRGEAPGLFGLTLDHDTWRVYGVYWCWFLAQFVISFAMSIVTFPFLISSMGQVMQPGGVPDADAMRHWQLTVQLPLALVHYLPLIFIGVRLSPAAATSIARRRFSFFEAWTVTHDRFWALFGSFALIWGSFFLVNAVVYAIVSQPMWPLFFNASTDPEQARQILAAMVSPQALMRMALLYVGLSLLGCVCVILAYGVNARAAMAALDEGRIAVVPPD